MRCCKTTSLSINKLFFSPVSCAVPFGELLTDVGAVVTVVDGGGRVHPYSIVYIIDIMFVSSCWLNKEQTLQRSTYTWPLAIFRLNSKPFFKVYSVLHYTVNESDAPITIRAKLRRHGKTERDQSSELQMKIPSKLYFCVSK